uniref:Thioredoxin domain-containing protein n=1 Tax=Davidia involucrata TaxID=16924 RepID=A0A5B7AHJ4_DAVIN
MACSLKNSIYVSGSNKTISCSRTKGVLGFCPIIGSLQFAESKSRYMGTPIGLSDQKGLREWSLKAPTNFSVHAQTSICVSRAMRWWEKTLQPNMIEINSAQELVDSLLNSGDRLVIVDFYSPGCGGCKALHPKICQLAESNPDAIFLKVNYEELKKMCYSLHIHVLPFFRIYRGAEGKLCSFSCTNATIKKFKDALAKHGTDRCTLGPAKGLDESELLNLASAGEISINLPLPSSTKEERMEDLVLKGMDMSTTLNKAGNKMELKEESAVLLA